LKKFRISIVALAVVALTGVTAAAALASAQAKVAFTAKYAGNATTKVDGNTATIAANGNGTASQIGVGSISGLGTADTSQQPCIPFTGTGTMKGSGGTITFKVVPGSSACGDEGGHNFTITSHLAVLRATGKLAKVKGTLKMTGAYSHDDGSFSVKVSGTLTK
jgi:type IV secretory pathway TraG/TraD family ATPase VirD4